MSADFICGVRYTRDNAANFVPSTITRLQRLFRARSLFIRHEITCPFYLPRFEFDFGCLFTEVTSAKSSTRAKIMVKISIRFRPTVCYFVRSKLISTINTIVFILCS